MISPGVIRVETFEPFVAKLTLELFMVRLLNAFRTFKLIVKRLL